MTTAAVIGSGPNGLAAAVVLARAGLRVTVHEGATTAGGGARTAPFGPPGYFRDTCSAVHPLALPSPFFRALGIEERAEYVSPDVSYAQVLTPDSAVFAYRSIHRTAQELGPDGSAWIDLLSPLADRMDDLAEVVLDSARAVPRHPLLATRFGVRVLEQSGILRNVRWSERAAPALLAGAIAHGATRIPSIAASAVGLVLAAAAHARGWPFPLGGANALTNALIQDLELHGGRVLTGKWVRSIRDLDADVVIAATSARDLAILAGTLVPATYRRRLEGTRYGPGVCKIDVAVDGLVPWRNARLNSAGTIHIGGYAEDVQASENRVHRGSIAERPFMLVTQPSVFDDSRAPAGGQTLWAYVRTQPDDQTDRSVMILDMLELHAPGLRGRIRHSTYTSARELGEINPNYVGGDIGSGHLSTMQLLWRPVRSLSPWRTPVPGLYLGSAAAVPGPGVHGMGGFHAAAAALSDLRIPLPAEFRGN